MLFYIKTLIYIEVIVATGLLSFRWAVKPRFRSIVSAKTGLIVLTTPVIALFSGNAYILYLYLAIIVAFNSRSRLELAGIFLFVLPSVPILTVETNVGGVYLFAMSTLTAMGLGALLGAVITSKQLAFIPKGYDLAVAILVFIFLYIGQRDPDLYGVLRVLAFETITLFGPYILVSRAARDLADIHQLLMRLALGATVMAATACFQAGRHWVLFETYYQALNIRLPVESAALSIRGGLLRTGGSMLDYSAGGLFLAAIVTTLPLLRNAFHRAGYWLVMTLLVGGLIATQSRGAWVAAIVGFIFVSGWRGQWQRVLTAFTGAAVLQLAIALSLFSDRIGAILGQGGSAAETAKYRQDLLRLGLKQIESYPLTGQPDRTLISKMSSLTQGQHIVDFVNTHLYIAMAAGIPLFVVWCLIWLMPLATAWAIRSQYEIITSAPPAIILVAFTALTFTSPIDRNLTWPIIGLALAGPCLVLGRRSVPLRQAIIRLPVLDPVSRR